MMDPVLVWALVAIAALGAVYDLVRRAQSLHRADELQPLRDAVETARREGREILASIERVGDAIALARQDAVKLRADFEAFVAEDAKTWDTVGLEWRQTVAEQNAKIDSVLNAAKTEINGALSGLDAMQGARRTWR